MLSLVEVVEVELIVIVLLVVLAVAEVEALSQELNLCQQELIV